jgi:hypothetical protein
METIHTIAWAIIINGVVHAFLTVRGGYQNIFFFFNSFLWKSCPI